MFQIKVDRFESNQIIHHGNQFLTGTLKLGVRGTLDEYGKDQLVAINLPLVYDQVGHGWRESVNCPNPLITKLYVNDVEISVLKITPFKHEQILDLKTAMMTRITHFKVNDLMIKVSSSRFVSLLNDRVIVGRYNVQVSQPAKIKIQTGIDGDIWDINGPHLENLTFDYNQQLIAHARTHEKGHLITVSKKVTPNFKVEIKLVKESFAIYKAFEINANPDVDYGFEYQAGICVDDRVSHEKTNLNSITQLNFDEHLQKQRTLWQMRWDDSDVLIEGDDDAQLALRYSIYHLLLLSPSVYNHQASIPARGISGQTYKGAVFWDTEIFMLPFYLNTDLMSARQIIDYRIKGLEGAKSKAQSYGFKGAFYAWESQEDGIEACTDYNVTDVFTKRLVRTYFRDKQIHISGDIIYALKSYILRTNDQTILEEGGLEMILEVARFYLDYGKYNVLKKRFEVWDVMGPDEYHERVHNNLFTNLLVKFVFDWVIKLKRQFEVKQDDYFETLVNELDFTESLNKIESLINQVYIPEPNSNGIIEQFDGYFKFKDIDKKELLKQRIHPNEYLGGHGLAGDTQIIKQADVITAMYLFRDLYSTELMKLNWNYYEPRTEHGSSLSASMYALVACFINQVEYAYPLFMKSATVDLTGDSKHYAGDVYIGGTHPAASGGAYMTAIYGFAGLHITDEIELNPKLPKHIKQMQFRIKHQGKKYQIKVNHQEVFVEEIK